MTLSAAQVEAVFAACFGASHRTVLRGGGTEPLYQPADREGEAHRIVYRADYVASALHEVAHWCIAGARRRGLVDYGYWYQPDGRDEAAQRAFEAVEVRPQALEWIFADACGLSFTLSADNVEAGAGPSARFAASVREERERLLAVGLPARSRMFRRALSDCHSRSAA
jgi:hypothetical protein